MGNVRAYLEAVEGAFGDDVDYAQLVKLYGEPTGQKGHERKYSPSVCTGAKKRRVEGSPDPAYVSTSHVERQNLTMRMQMRRFTRLTNAFAKKFENHMHMVALYTVWYNFIRVHRSLRVTPAMAAGLSPSLRRRSGEPGRWTVWSNGFERVLTGWMGGIRARLELGAVRCEPTIASGRRHRNSPAKSNCCVGRMRP